jgi:hypothetical protein
MTDKHEANYPSAPDLAKNLFETAKQLARNPLPADDETYLRREKICNSCEHFDQRQNRCRKCGCMLKAKMRIKLAKCKVGKW